jgi:hypothetical protein
MTRRYIAWRNRNTNKPCPSHRCESERCLTRESSTQTVRQKPGIPDRADPTRSPTVGFIPAHPPLDDRLEKRFDLIQARLLTQAHNATARPSANVA